MTLRPALRPLVALLAFGAACAPSTTTPPPAPAPPSPAAADDPRTPAEIEALWLARLDSATMHFTDADVAFIRGMIHHHAQALEMTALAETNTDDPTIGILAARITNAQRDEIASMERWLEDRGLEAPQVHPTAHHAHAGVHVMPGMLSAEEMDRLAAASGEAFDRLFLELMIRHHRGAITMVHALFATDGAAQDEAVFKLASDVQVDQATEIARMERMLAAMADGAP